MFEENNGYNLLCSLFWRSFIHYNYVIIWAAILQVNIDLIWAAIVPVQRYRSKRRRLAYINNRDPLPLIARRKMTILNFDSVTCSLFASQFIYKMKNGGANEFLHVSINREKRYKMRWFSIAIEFIRFHIYYCIKYEQMIYRLIYALTMCRHYSRIIIITIIIIAMCD